ncbi:hypothetical protein [Mycobacterium asiaticum]|uniref:hypothetical protein n=1 Tax=Mycobacterium asiaticum TaxID=1790 RepID=UPI000B204A0D|nr:hypothetical protein [Mycobacterium asiaticum]
MFKHVRHFYVPGLAVVSLLLAFAFLGGLVAALAAGSSLAIAAAIGLIACLVGAVAGFRASGRKIALFKDSDDPSNNISIFSTPLRREQIDRYFDSYRRAEEASSEADSGLTVLVGGRAPKYDVAQVVEDERVPALTASAR